MQAYPVLTFAHAIPDVVERYAANPAMAFVGEEPLTYAGMGSRIRATMAFLEGNGIRPGDKVVILSQNMPHWGIVYFALQCMGVVAVPVLPEFSAAEVEHVLQHSEARAVFISESLAHRLKEISSVSPELVVRIDDMEVTSSRGEHAVFTNGLQPAGTYDPDENALAVLLYTSGTTGNAKSVMLSQKNILTNVMQGNSVQPVSSSDNFLSVLPLAHTYENTLGLVLPVMNGAFIHYLRKPPTASVLVPAMQQVRPELMLTVPMIIEKVFRNKVLPGIQAKALTRLLYRFRPTQKLLHRVAGKKVYQTFGGRLKFYGIGGAKLDATVERFLRDARFPYAIGYGLTETAPLLAGSNASGTRFQAIGPAVVHCELKIHNPNPVTGEGEIWAKGPNIMLGYYKNEELTREVLTEDGWFRTGDLGVFDKDGWLSHKGRLKNVIVGSNGENIYPEEIESVINGFRHVIESLVIEQKGKLVAMVHFNREELEQRFMDFKDDLAHKMEDKIHEIRAKADETIHELAKELQQYVNARVNRFSRIHQLLVHPEPFQKTATKKIKRYLYL